MTWNNDLRTRWETLAAKHQAAWRPIEVVCSNPDVHRQRVATRQRRIAGIPEVSWQRVEEARTLYEDWISPRLVLDSARPLEVLVREAISYVLADAAAT